jgi:hypothetical protein
MGCSERKKELRRRRHRTQKITTFARKAQRASFSEKQAIASKLRLLTPGAETIIQRMELEARG